jgi:urease accessory protein
MPDSVSPFRSSRYSQVQRFELADRSASLLVLDWVNSGRGQRGPGRTFIDGNDEEVWVMGHYGSTNEVWIGDELVMRERQVLEGAARQLAPYHVYGTLLILGPAFAPLLEYLAALTDHTAQMQIHSPPTLLWAYSRTDEQGGVLRIAAEEVEDAKRWLREVMTFAGVDGVVGEGLWPRVI